MLPTTQRDGTFTPPANYGLSTGPTEGLSLW